MIHAQNKLPLWFLKIAVRLSGRPTGVSNELQKKIAELGSIFIHIPKCAGNAVQQSLFGEVVFGHQTIRQYQVALPSAVYRDAWKFTVTRDPWERIVSAWKFLKAGGYHAEDAKYFAENLSQYPSFDHFVNDWLVFQDLNQCGSLHLKPQLHYIRDFHGKIPMDYIVKLSDLADEYRHIRDRIGGSELSVHNKTEGAADYREFYDDKETFENVSRIYAEDIKTLGYSSSLDGVSLP